MHTGTGDNSRGGRLRPRSNAGAVGSTKVELVEGLPQGRLLQEWDELALATSAEPWVRPGWLLPWWRWMGRGTPGVLTLRSADRQLLAALPLQCGPRSLVSPTNWHNPAYGVVAVDSQARRTVLRRALETCGSRLRLDFVSAALAEELAALSRAEGGRCHVRVLESSPYLPLENGWERSLDGRALAEIRRRARRLAERGELVVDVRDGSAGLDSLLTEGFAVEASGWKGREGTAISCSASTAGFYRGMARWAAHAGLLRLAYLRLDGRALAFDLSIEHAGVHYLLKTGFEESERRHGPGKLLRLRMLENCAARGLRTYDFLGNAQPWKLEWSALCRDRMQVFGFPPGPAGRQAHVVYAELLPLARRARRALAGRTAASAGAS